MRIPIIKNKFELIVAIRPLAWIFRRDWYTTIRWECEGCNPGEILYLLDIGMISIGYAHTKV